MTNEIDVMPYDATLLAKVLEERGVTVLALASRAGYDDKSIYRYLAGERTCPSTVLRAAFELTGDLRIIGLIAGAVPICVHPVGVAPAASGSAPPPPAQRIPPVDQLFPQAADAIEHLSRSLKYMHKIVADGRVDQSDAAAIESFTRYAAESQRLIALSLAAVESHRQRSVA